MMRSAELYTAVWCLPSTMHRHHRRPFHASHGRLHGLPVGWFQIKWHADIDCRSAHRPRLKRNRSLHEPCSFLHARETQTPPLPRRFDIEAFACVDDRELEFVRALRQLHVDAFNATVLDCVVKGFL